MELLPPDGGPMTEAAVIQLRRRLVDAGYLFIPEITARKFTCKPFADWRDRPAPFRPEERYANQYGILLNTAIILRAILAFDIDIDDPKVVAQVLDVLDDVLGQSPCERSRRGSARRAVLYGYPDSGEGSEGLYAALTGGIGTVEVFAGARTKLTCFGWHIDKVTKASSRLEWIDVPGNVTRAELPVVTATQVLGALQTLSTVIGGSVVHRVPGSCLEGVGVPTQLLATDIDELCRAASYVPNEGPCPWQRWNYVGMALFAATGGAEAGLDAFWEWSAKNSQSARRDCDKRWESYCSSPPGRIGAGTVIMLAQQNGYQRPAVRKAAEMMQARLQRRARDFVPPPI